MRPEFQEELAGSGRCLRVFRRRSLRPRTLLPTLFLALPLLFGPLYADRASAGVDRLLVEKSERRLSLIKNDDVIRYYTIALGANPIGHKQQEGDERTPEGHYLIDTRKPDSAFHRALHISYPNEADRRRAEELGVDPGGSIMIHGLPEGWDWLGQVHHALDWTDGCIAVTNYEIEEIWSLVEDGTPIEILP